MEPYVIIRDVHTQNPRKKFRCVKWRTSTNCVYIMTLWDEQGAVNLTDGNDKDRYSGACYTSKMHIKLQKNSSAVLG